MFGQFGGDDALASLKARRWYFLRNAGAGSGAIASAFRPLTSIRAGRGRLPGALARSARAAVPPGAMKARTRA